MPAAPLPADDEVCSVAGELLAAHRCGGSYPTVTALASHFGINRTTFYRHFRQQAEAMLDTAGQQNLDSRKRRRPVAPENPHSKDLRRLRDDNENLRRHVEIYEEHIRMLTLVNTDLREQLKEAAGVARISPNRPS